MQVHKFMVPEIIFGQGALAQVGEATRRLGATTPLVVIDPGVIAAGWLDILVPFLADEGLRYVVWTQFSSNPKDHEVAQGVAFYRQHGCDAVVAIGGGSCIDAGKAIAVLSTNGGQIQSYEGIDRIVRPLPPMVMLPTTAGSASDVSQFAAINDTARGIKMTLISKSLIPEISITDPMLLTTLSPRMTACTGMDALTHGIEAYLSLAATFLTDLHALAAIRLVAANLRASVASANDLAVKSAMASASLHAGLASSNAILGATHALGHQIDGLLDQVHGELNAILLPYVMEFNQAACAERYVAIAQALGIDTTRLSVGAAGEAAIAAVRALAHDIGLTRSLSDLGVTTDQLSHLSSRALLDACMVTNPRPATQTDVEALFRAAL